MPLTKPPPHQKKEAIKCKMYKTLYLVVRNNTRLKSNRLYKTNVVYKFLWLIGNCIFEVNNEKHRI